MRETWAQRVPLRYRDITSNFLPVLASVRASKWPDLPRLVTEPGDAVQAGWL